MAQQLKVFQDPSIVQNVPTTQAEQLQIALEKKAAQMAASGAPSSVIAKAIMDAAGPGSDWGTFTGFTDDTPYGVRSMDQIAADSGPIARNKNDIIVNKPAPKVALMPSSIDAAGALDLNRLGLTAQPRQAPAVQAIQQATDTGLPFAGTVGGVRGSTRTPVGPAPIGDPWGGMRIGTTPQRPGMVTSNAQRPIQAPSPRYVAPAPGPAPVAAAAQSGGGNSGGGGNGGGGQGSFQGTSTGNTYNVGQVYETHSYGGTQQYQAQANGSFKRVA